MSRAVARFFTGERKIHPRLSGRSLRDGAKCGLTFLERRLDHLTVDFDTGPFAEQFKHLDFIGGQNHRLHIHRDQIAQDLAFWIFQRDGQIARDIQRHKILVAREKCWAFCA